MSDTANATSGGLVRAVGRWSLVALLLNSVIGSGVFGVPSLVARSLGSTSPWTYLALMLIAAAGIGAIMACFAEVASRFTEAGGPYLYARRAFGRFVGIEMGWLAYLVRVTSAAANASLFVIYVAEFWPGAGRLVVRGALLAMLLGVLATVNYRGVRGGAAVSNAFIIAKLAPLILFVLASLGYLVLHGTPATTATGLPGTKGWLDTLLILTFYFGGFEAGLMPMGEARSPRRDAPFALLMTLLVCTIFFSVIQVVVVAVLPAAGSTDRPLAAAAHIVFGPTGAALMSVAALLSTYGYLSGMMLNVPRLTFALAEQHDFPAWFGRVHPRFRTPYVSIGVFSALAWALALWGSFGWNVVLSSVARLFTYALVCASLPVLRRRRSGEPVFRLPAGPVFATGGIAFAVVLVTRMGWGELYVLAGTLLLATITWLWAKRRTQATISSSVPR